LTKGQLRRYGKLRKEYEILREQIETIDSAMRDPKIQRITGMPGSGSKESRALEDLLIKREALKQKLIDKMVSIAEEQEYIENAINGLEPNERSALRAHYIQGLSWEDAAMCIGVSEATIHRIHAASLLKLAEEDDYGRERP